MIKRISILVLIFNLFGCCPEYLDMLYKYSESTNDSTYGYTIENPLKIGGGNFLERPHYCVIEKLRTEKGERLIWLKEKDILKQDIIKCTLMSETSKDTIILYFDLYHLATFKTPVNLKIYEDD